MGGGGDGSDPADSTASDIEATVGRFAAGNLRATARELTTLACELYALVELLEAKGVLKKGEFSTRVSAFVQARGDQIFEDILEGLTDGAIARIDEAHDDAPFPGTGGPYAAPEGRDGQVPDTAAPAGRVGVPPSRGVGARNAPRPGRASIGREAR